MGEFESFALSVFFHVAAKGDFFKQRFQVVCCVVPTRLEREDLVRGSSVSA